MCAAGHYAMTPVSEITAGALHRMLRVHLGGLRNTGRAVLPSMLGAGAGAIVAVTSELAIGGGDGDAHYAAAKGAVIGLVRSLAAEVAAARGPGQRGRARADGHAVARPPTLPGGQPEYLATLPNRRLDTAGRDRPGGAFLLDDEPPSAPARSYPPTAGR